MRTAFTYTFLLLLLMAAAGCYKDKGNYDYHEPNKVILKDTLAGKLINVNKGEPFSLSPAVSQTQVTDNANLSYEWSTYSLSGSTLRKIISHDKELHIIIDTAFTLGANYAMTYKVTDNISGESVYMKYNLSVGNKYTEGWILLQDINGTTDYSMILPGGEIVHNVYKLMNGASLPDKPVGVFMSRHSVDDGITTPSRKMYLLTANGGLEMDYTTLIKRTNFPLLFYKAPTVIKPAYMSWPSAATGVGPAINSGKLYLNVAGGFPGVKKWGEMLLSPENDNQYELANFVAIGNSLTTNTFSVAVYDKLKKRFCVVKGSGNSLDSFHTKASKLFNLNNTGMDLMHMDNSPQSEVNAIMKDAAGQPWFCRFRMNFTTTDSVMTQMYQQMNAPGITNMSNAASSVVTDHIYYGVNNTVYRYEPASNSTKVQFTFPANEHINLVRCPVPLAGPPSVAIVTWDGTQSRLYSFLISLTGEISNYSESYSGFGKVVDAQYKFR